MLRENYNNEALVREYKNGNLLIRYYPEGREFAARDEILALSEALDLVDCYFIGDTYCLSNWETGHTIYNAYSDLVYIFAWSDLEKLAAGRAVRLYARRPDETDREIISREWGCE